MKFKIQNKLDAQQRWAAAIWWTPCTPRVMHAFSFSSLWVKDHKIWGKSRKPFVVYFVCLCVCFIPKIFAPKSRNRRRSYAYATVGRKPVL